MVPALKFQLAKRRCLKNLYALVCSYLQDREIMVNYARATSQRETMKGCVQGSIGGPTSWNIILDPLLQKLEKEEVHCQAFADDVVLIFNGHNISQMEETANSTLETVVEWGVQSKLNFAAHKTSAMLLTKKLKYQPPQLFMSGSRLNLLTETKLLGLTIDRNLTFKTHVTANSKKAADIYKQLACAAKVTWGLNSEITRTIYVAVIEPIVMYAASAWSQATEFQMIRNRLDSLQRGFAQKICRAYRTVSLTSALILSGLLPLDLRKKEAASLYSAKKGISADYIPPERQLEQKQNAANQSHPSQLITTEFELLENMDPETLQTYNIAGPLIFTDGSKMGGKVGAALTLWEEGQEKSYSTFSLDSTCTVFQSELYALHRAVENSSKRLVNILSDSRSSLELLQNPRQIHPLTSNIKESIKKIRAEGREVRLFWLRVHVGTAGNERADVLEKQTAVESTGGPDYGEVPVSHVKRKIREETVQKRQDRYISSSTGSVTKVFFPDAAKAYRIVRKTKMTPQHVQAFTGHGGMAEYLHRFKLKTSPACECDPDTCESVWHILLEFLQQPRFTAARMELEFQLNITLEKSVLNGIIADENARPYFYKFVCCCSHITPNANTNGCAKSHHSSSATCCQCSTTCSATEKEEHPVCPSKALQRLWTITRRGSASASATRDAATRSPSPLASPSS